MLPTSFCAQEHFYAHICTHVCTQIIQTLARCIQLRLKEVVFLISEQTEEGEGMFCIEILFHVFRWLH